MKSAKLDKKVSFQQRVAADDGLGNTLGAFAEVFKAWGCLKELRGGEGVLDARRQSKQPSILTIHATNSAREITPDWQAVITGVAYDIKEPPRMTEDRLFLEMLVERGHASG